MSVRKIPANSPETDPAFGRIASHKDPYYFRNRQSPARPYRKLTIREIEILERNGNRVQDWNQVRVVSPFDPGLVRNCEFRGLVRLGCLEPGFLEYNELCLPIGLCNASLTDCDVGDDVVLRNVAHMSRMIVGERSILFNLDEVLCTPHAKFGAGVVKDGEPEDVRVWLELGNENGGRRILAFPGMLPADAFLWSRLRADTRLLRRLIRFTEDLADTRQGYYGFIGQQCVIKNSRIIKDSWIGPHCYVKGANKLKNVSLLSSEKEPTQIGEGVELVNGIVGHGSRIFYGCKAVRFVTGRNVQLKYGARVINSFVGDNSTISCCEILNSLLFPFHEQHHNSSFLIAATVMGQSNIAANATIGSNHNSRSPDGEILAGRGFWAGLSTSFKFNSRFGSFVLAAHGDYPFEINIPFPFSLISRDASKGHLTIMPAYWFLHNMYAIARNEWKFEQRDVRAVKEQKIETRPLAPDTVEEILSAMELLEEHAGKEVLRRSMKRGEPRAHGREFLRMEKNDADIPELWIEGLAKTSLPSRIAKPGQAYRAYQKIVIHYAVRAILEWLKDQPAFGRKLVRLVKDLRPLRPGRWWNLGGQIVLDADLEKTVRAIKSGRLSDWNAVHDQYKRLWRDYPRQRLRHALGCVERLLDIPLSRISSAQWKAILLEGARVQEEIADQTRLSRRKDYTNAFRNQVYDSTGEMKAVLGSLEGNSFIRKLDAHTKVFVDDVKALARQQ